MVSRVENDVGDYKIYSIRMQIIAIERLKDFAYFKWPLHHAAMTSALNLATL